MINPPSKNQCGAQAHASRKVSTRACNATFNWYVLQEQWLSDKQGARRLEPTVSNVGSVPIEPGAADVQFCFLLCLTNPVLKGRKHFDFQAVPDIIGFVFQR